jgi:chromosomal replication initiation ATPase DnaA
MDKIQHIIQIVSQETSTPVSEIIGKSRKGRIIFARHLSLWACRWNSGASLEKIARAHRLAQHGSVIHAAASIDDQIKCYPKIAEICNQILNQLNNQ